MGENGKVLIKDLEKKDKKIFSLWLQDINVVKFLIDLFKISREKDNVLNIPFGKNRKMFVLETKEGVKLGFCVLYDIDWQQKRSSMYIYIEKKENVELETAQEIINSLLRRTALKYNLRDIEVHTKNDVFAKCFTNIEDFKKEEDGYSFRIALDEMKFPANMAR
ncbi:MULTISPECIES: hypothetical protein [Thermoanaerobacter]|uniref:N-acetyltransferase domain-containing protein n=3 Tax=Thermoanaerobacter TaxID=1754 RepID=I9KUW2_9THEO|nr:MULTISPECIES: hypothetical protein [Thermoanaerobacter]EGD51075.1 hypothetical protein TheetDRAFT_2139 [Thermoanaerobacter ethanolicus JW 200]SFE16121.1 hypothetical protein SAMN04324257_00752 [Thermoanaerobacter thermohydrosulfuricus]HHY80259.1 hypothetical protein [Thermoanaerobacter sp.]AEM78305.1 hypothetical protein Thewi_0875 [Thermoanaerobacter wiegelii Rt8.B1]EIW00774.1 hypothetical protein ThesiDRAFT1_1896 [Thermoanaerobacter siderophilus SR4]